MNKKVPLVYYQANGEQIIVGEVEVDTNGEDKISAINVDTEAIAKINGPIDYKAFSIASHPEVEKRRNVFDKFEE